MILMVTGCGNLEPFKVDEEYVKNAFEKSLKKLYGPATFVVDVLEFNETFEEREAKAIAFPKKESSLTFEISG